MRVIYINNNLAKGGSEKLITDTMPFFKKSGIDISVLLLSKKDSAEPYLAHLKANDIVVHWLDEGSVYNPSKIFKLRKYLMRQKPDIVHVNLFPGMYWVAFVKRLGMNTPIVFTEHSNQNRRFNIPAFRPIDRWIYRAYDKIIAISPAIADKLNTWAGLPEKITIIRNGVDTSRFKDAGSYDAIAFRSELNLTPDSVILMMTARFSYPKNHKTIISALKELPSHYMAVFVGEGEEQQTVADFATELGLTERVHFLGFRTDIPQLMKTADINILSSEYEGMSGVTCEALAAGQPFLGSNVPGINDVVPDERFLFEAANSAELAKKILYVIGQPNYSDQMINDGLSWVKQFDTMEMVSKITSLYAKLLKVNK